MTVLSGNNTCLSDKITHETKQKEYKKAVIFFLIIFSLKIFSINMLSLFRHLKA